MARQIIDLQGFEAKFQADSDPWNYRQSRFEASKRGSLLHACGPRIYGRGLELACANGETTRLLARKCLRLLAVDGSPSALAAARKRLAGLHNITLAQANLPTEMPRGPFDLIVISELLYYLPPRDLDTLLGATLDALAPAGRLVVLHHTVFFDDVAIHPARAQGRAKDVFGRWLRPVFHRALAHYDVAAFEKRSRPWA
jgi:SAM-dependent methyltransferase